MKTTPYLIAAMLVIAGCSSDSNTTSTDAGSGGANTGGSSGSGGTTASTGGSSGSGGSTVATGGKDGGSGTGGSTGPTFPMVDASDNGIDGSAPAQIDRSHLKDTGTTAPLDFSDPALWLCRPGINPDECFTNLDTTEFLKNNTTQFDKHVRAKDPEYDCFYVYPTVALGGNGNMTDFSDISLTLDPLLAQAARFTRLCRVYAPLYRQVSLSLGGSTPADAGKLGDGGVGITGDPKLAYSDVKGAFQYYMDHFNGGRKFVLMGHSQGTAMLTQLMTEEFDTDATLRAKLISALLIGGNIAVPTGKTVGGTFKNIPLCTAPGQTGCVVAYNSFSKDAPPPANSLFGRAATGMQDACTNPATLSGNTGRYLGSYTPLKFYDPIFAPDQPPAKPPLEPTPFVMDRDLFRGTCVSAGGFTYLQIVVDQTADDKRTVTGYRNTASEAIGFGMHIFDYSIELEDLISAVDLQAKAALGGD